MATRGGVSNWRLTEDGKVYRHGRKRYANSDLYDGEFCDGKREGKGVYEYSGGNRYVGEFMNNLYEGFGVFSWAPFTEGNRVIRTKRYEGDWLKGRQHGQGMLICGDGDVYTGHFEADLYHGQGILAMKNGDRMEGMWERGKLNGLAKIAYANGDRYEGDFFSGKFQGKGRYVYAHGRGWYEGAYYQGRQHGRGLRVFMNNNRYEGQFKFGEMQGEGIMEFNNGQQYIGQWSQGRMHGRGVLQMVHGERYEGEFMNGYFFGRGRYTWSDGGYYEGEYVMLKTGYDHGVAFPDPNGKRNGRGVRHWVSGDKYEGEWSEDQIHGDGVIRKASGGLYQGNFRWSKKQGKGTETWGNKMNISFVCPMGYRHEGRGFCTYEGGYMENYFHGEGTFTCIDGRCFNGGWRRGRRHGWGTQVMLPVHERGEPRRMHIGGLGGMYRTQRFTGHWEDGTRQGEGTIEYANGVKVVALFTHGQITGNAKWIFPSGIVRMGVYEDGERVGWAEAEAEEQQEEEDKMDVLKALLGAKEDADGYDDARAKREAQAAAERANAAAFGL
mmetsp:Transcript_233/g.463  ORF Transcript_233/g.463 Transcript_233/m.463 type:complete len:553 (-) Transcript_233:175-1833(-)